MRALLFTGAVSLLTLMGCGDAPKTDSNAESDISSEDVSVTETAIVSEDITTLDGLAHAILKEHGLVGLAISTYYYNDAGELVSEKAAAGLRKVNGDEAVTVNDKWHIGSCTKAITALLFLDTVRGTEMSLDTSVGAVFKDHVEVIDPAWNNISMKQVLTHRAGIKDFGAGWFLKRVFDERPLAEQRLETVAQLLAEPPELTVGDFQYSNIGYILAGSAVEVLSEQPWEEAVKSGLTGQIMGEDGWGFGPPQGDQPLGHREAVFGKKLKPATQTWEGGDNPAVMGPAGTAHAEHDVWAKFALAFLPVETALSDADKALMLTPHDGANYALGWGMSESEEFGTIYSHAGSNTMWLSQVMIVPEKKAVVLVSTNTPPDRADKAVRKVTREAIRRIK